MSDYYDVRTGMDNKNWTPVVGSVNLMCALLKDINYSKLYDAPFWINGDNTCAVEMLKSNAQNLHPDLMINANGAPAKIHDWLFFLFDSIAQQLSKDGVPPVHLKHLFLRDVTLIDLNPVIAAENAALNDINTKLTDFFSSHGDKMNHFCTPFMYMQSSKTFISNADWGEFISNCGHHNLRQLFSLERKSTKGNAVNRARTNFILKDKSKSLPYIVVDARGSEDTLHLFTPNGGNSRICQNGSSCVASAPDNWCSLTEGGVCSAMSDHE